MDSGLSAAQRLAVRPDRLLTQNRNLRRDGIFNWCLPAWAGRMADGIPHFLKRQSHRTFRSWQIESDAARTQRSRQPST
jgi:hypothetical protein